MVAALSYRIPAPPGPLWLVAETYQLPRTPVEELIDSAELPLRLEDFSDDGEENTASLGTAKPPGAEDDWNLVECVDTAIGDVYECSDSASSCFEHPCQVFVGYAEDIWVGSTDAAFDDPRTSHQFAHDNSDEADTPDSMEPEAGSSAEHSPASSGYLVHLPNDHGYDALGLMGKWIPTPPPSRSPSMSNTREYPETFDVEESDYDEDDC